MFEELLKEFKQLEKKITEKLDEIKSVQTEDDLYTKIDLSKQLFTSSDAIKGYGMFREDLGKKPFQGAFPDIFKPSKDRSKEETGIIKKYVYYKGLNELT